MREHDCPVAFSAIVGVDHTAVLSWKGNDFLRGGGAREQHREDDTNEGAHAGNVPPLKRISIRRVAMGRFRGMRDEWRWRFRHVDDQEQRRNGSWFSELR
jgi:hypothetical protein